jgi:endogenous inhibitor of DNA gyrase (YacG/DUF329 family)
VVKPIEKPLVKCAVCGRAFYRRAKHQRYCTARCAKVARKLKDPGRKTRG